MKKGPDVFHVCLISPSRTECAYRKERKKKRKREERSNDPVSLFRADGIRAVCTDKGTGEAQWTVPVFHPSATSVRFLVSVYSTITRSPSLPPPFTRWYRGNLKFHFLAVFVSFRPRRKRQSFHSRLVTHIDGARASRDFSRRYRSYIANAREGRRKKEETRKRRGEKEEEEEDVSRARVEDIIRRTRAACIAGRDDSRLSISITRTDWPRSRVETNKRLGSTPYACARASPRRGSSSPSCDNVLRPSRYAPGREQFIIRRNRPRRAGRRI